MDRDTEIKNPQNETQLESENQTEAPVPKKDSKIIQFWIMGQKVLEVSLMETESLWEIHVELSQHPLVSLFPNYQCFLNGKPMGKIESLPEYLKTELPKDHSGPVRIELSPSSMSIHQSRMAVLALVQLIKNPKVFLANKMFQFHQTVGRKNLIEAALQGLDFDCGQMTLEDCLASNLESAEQFLKLEIGEKGNTIRLEKNQTQEIRELQFLRQLVLPSAQVSDQEGFEEYFEVLVETIERNFLGFVFSKRGVYLSRKIERLEKGEEVSLQLLSLPRENKKRMSGFFPSMIPLLAKESPAFAQRFQEFVEREIPASKEGEIEMLLKCPLKNIRFQYKHWLNQGALKSSDLLGEGRSSFFYKF